MPLQFINPALQGAKGISNLKTLLFGGGPVGAIMLGASQAPRFIEAGRQNPTGSSKLSLLGSMGSNLSNDLTPRPPMPGLPADYKQTELAAGAAAERFRPGAGFPGQQAAAERAYESEKARVSQLTAQDPELKRYEEASKKAKTQEEMNAARDIGMQIWAQRNSTLAKKVKPGQSGYEVIQNELNAGQMGPVMDLPFDTTKPFSPTPIPPEQQSVTYEGVRPATLGEVTPITGGGFPTQQAAMFERFRQAISPTTPSFQGSPLGTATPPVGNLAYTGSIAPLGTAVEGGDFRSEQAQKLAEMFKKAQFAG